MVSRNGADRRPIQQDFIARIRYSNALPPPPHPPKLLDMPQLTGLASVGQYTSPGFASRLAREQPLNIEADAELGMPLDLVGMPRIFDGDESSIMSPAPGAPALPIHPHDRALLRPLSTLGKPKTADGAVSFLRRTEYISSASNKALGPGKSTNSALMANKKRPLKRKSPEPELDRDSPAYVKRKIEQSFTQAEQALKDPWRVRHPSKRNVKLVGAYPLLPDRDAFPDSGAYVTLKYMTNPVPDNNASSSQTRQYDKRLLSALFRPIDQRNNPNSQAREKLNYHIFLPDRASTGDKFQRAFDVDKNEHETEEQCFPFNRLRAYESVHEQELSHDTKYDEELILAFHDGGGGGQNSTNTKDQSERNQKAAYYYPVMQRSHIRPQRTKNIARNLIPEMAEDDADRPVDQLDVAVSNPPPDTDANMRRFRDDPYGLTIGDGEDDDAAPAAAAGYESQHQQTPPSSAGAGAGAGRGRQTQNARSSSSPARNVEHSDEELDAEGDEEG